MTVGDVVMIDLTAMAICSRGVWMGFCGFLWDNGFDWGRIYNFNKDACRWTLLV